jgi:glycosyltransferase involved in cell wall biosynthesis
MPVFNVEDYVEQAILSILNQTFVDFELFIIDDCSTDGTVKKIELFTDNRIVVIKNKRNEGLVYSLNLGIKLANGIFIARMDGDDISEPERLEYQVKAANEYNLDLCGCHWLTINSLGGHLKAIYSPTDLNEMEISFANGSPFAHGSILLRRKFIINNNIYYGSESFAEDYKLFVQIKDIGGIVGSVDKFLYRYRVLHSSWSSIKRKEYNEIAYKIRKEYFLENHVLISKAIKNITNLWLPIQINPQVNLNLFVPCFKLLMLDKSVSTLLIFINIFSKSSIHIKLVGIRRIFLMLKN